MMTMQHSLCFHLYVFLTLLVASSIVCTGGSSGSRSASFLESWMGNMLSVLKDQTLLDLSLPGTHDSMSYDLSTIVSLGADDGSDVISWILHYASEIGVVPGDWIRNQSKTQGLDVVGQLNNGVRFLDFRIMYTSDDWYCLHFMQSNQKTLTYLTQVRKWLDAHPQEIVVLWLSKHGSACATGNDQYPDVPVATKRAFWNQILQVMDGILTNVVKYPINETSISNLIANNQRVVIYASDYTEFSGNSSYAMDGCMVDNTLCSGVSDEVDGYNCEMAYLKNATQILAQDKKQNKFYLMSMASSGPGTELEYSFLSHFIDIERDANIRKCAAVFGIPGMDDWCPPNLIDISQLTNYYNQLPLEAAYQNQWDFPNAIYIDAVDIDGTIRTGSQIFQNDNNNELSRYSYSPVLLLRNLRKACGNSKTGDCGSLDMVLQQLKAQYPLLRWDDAAHGRTTNWPVKE